MTQNRPLIVQFLHDGPEHSICKRDPSTGTFEWSRKPRHARKFLRARGSIRDSANGIGETTDITFWGEWEAPSRYLRLPTPWFNGHLPTLIHDPYVPLTEPTGWRQNTDPMVFGHSFAYTNCKQHRRDGRSTVLRSLPIGSLILFGSPKRNPARFILDTVFVVGEFHHDEVAASREFGTDLLVDVAYRPAGNGTLPWPNTTYFGVKPSGGVSNPKPYSFVPAKRATDPEPWFARPTVAPNGALSSFIVPSKPMGQIARSASANEVEDVWGEIVSQVVDRDGLSLATTFDEPPRSPD